MTFKFPLIRTIAVCKTVVLTVALGMGMASTNAMSGASAQASELRSKGVSRSGVVFDKRKFKRDRKIRNKEFGLVERRRQIEARNRRVARQELIERKIRSDERIAQSKHYDKDYYDDRSGVIFFDSTPDACPVGHNCGIRLYGNGSGPRIIILGASNNGRELQDGLNGPKIITLD